MQLEALVEIAARYKDELPDPLPGDLRDVEIMVAPTVAAARDACAKLFEINTPEEIANLHNDIPLTLKGCFIGDPMEREAHSNEDDGEEELVTLPEGVILLVAENLTDEVEAAQTLLHETGHALGLDEAGVEALGLGVPGKAPSTTEGGPAPS
jgi:predicted Zn-dependent protease with MMP-like domain